jgi:hypothetical protein
MKFARKINFKIFGVVFLPLFILSAYSFILMFDRAEGAFLTKFQNTIADMFTILRLPSDLIGLNYWNGAIFIGLIINCLIYAFLIERIIVLFSPKSESNSHTRQDPKDLLK